MKKVKKLFKNSKGFTLLELLVVVLIIGILAAVALPQYRKSVEKTRASEALMNIQVMEQAVKSYTLARGNPTERTNWIDLADIELSGGEWEENNAYCSGGDMGFKTKYFFYCSNLLTNGIYFIYAHRVSDDGQTKYVLGVYSDPDSNYYGRSCNCRPNSSECYICDYTKSFGFKKLD